ncbi:DUF1987 domain-containing protein [Dickeya dadantii]|uniref:Fe-S Oxidoreductase n=1 Tax=Dickeya dadantii (strain 3937) TaxID=198628 RepID=E0SCH0_DICD3|nr:DUF1987 domain-containing protein [Dickeya dadantii]ADM97320.1 Fe-S Oxidoreductase [Dickeya dadantii 3937]MCL6404380.1 DUF1987 domain-containing protein [Dickeya dadantii]NAT76978.1 DUF1987 domain-containing protein [Dickeya dadantii]NPE51266.1 DUF1987 domain-containing protein [Dickeya dadantii]NPE54973.1 DUF1987 domain-containing protein [Dickeya dadantii]
MTDIITTDNLYLAGTASTPTVDFRFDTHQLSLSGESYPENAAAFYGPLIERIQRYLQARLATTATPSARIDVHVSLPYFNSSSTKMLFSLFNILDQAAQQQLPIALHWYYDQEDDIAEEFGQELHIDFSALEFHPHILE